MTSENQTIVNLVKRIDRLHESLSNLAGNVASLEEALAVSADELLTYKDYYGTSPAQVKHLSGCDECSPANAPQYPYHCPDYPSE